MNRRLALVCVALLALLTVGGLTLARFWPELSKTGESLSLFEPHAGGCVWSKHDIARDRTTMVTRFPAECQGAQVAWSPDGRTALVWFAPDGAAPQDVMLYQVDIEAGKLVRLPLPEVGDAERFLIDRRGRTIAFTVDPPDDGLAGALEFEGRTFQPAQPGPGIDALVHALMIGEDGIWRVVETRASRCCDDDAPGIAALALYAQARRDDELWELQSQARLVGSETFGRLRSEALKSALRARQSSDANATEDGPWLAFTRAGWPRSLIFRGIRSQGWRATGLAMFARVESASPLPELAFAPTDVIRVAGDGSHLLMTEWATGALPHLYDVRTGTLVFQSKVATGTVFWPHFRPPTNEPSN